MTNETVYQDAKGWWADTGEDCYGPYRTEKVAREVFEIHRGGDIPTEEL